MLLIYDRYMRKGTGIRDINGFPIIKPFIIFIFNLNRAGLKTCPTADTCPTVYKSSFLFDLNDKITVKSKYFFYFTECYKF